MKFLVIILFLIGFTGILEFSFAEMDYSQFLDYCDKSLGLLDSMTIEERLLTLLCNYIDSGFTEKRWIWLNGSNFDWNNFAQKASENFARTIPEFINGGIEDTLVVNSWVSGRESFPPPMGVTISFDYYDDSVIEHFEQDYRDQRRNSFLAIINSFNEDNLTTNCDLQMPCGLQKDLSH